ncbi:MAG TPA: hypothetical protein VMH23_19710 [Bacteroidota bacterium]|nr:hypothetical protein [Bacteroidota bacterium]
MQNGKPKVDIGLNQEAKLTLLRDKCYEGKNNFGAYYLYSVQHDGEEKAFFATIDVHQAILESGIRTGDQFVIRKKPIQNGRRITSKIEFEVISKQPAPAPNGNGNGSHLEDSLRDMLLQCVVDADSIIKSAGVQVSDELQKLATTLFIARSRMN